jgi:hypothetical protein
MHHNMVFNSLLDNWKQVMDKDDIVKEPFIDLKKALDYVNPDLLLLKLFHYGFDNKALVLLRDYFTGRTQQTRIGKFFSEFILYYYVCHKVLS